MQNLKPGTELSYSAGRKHLDPYAYRMVRPSDGRIEHILSKFPQLIQFFSEKPPLLINCYPASLGFFENAIKVDTYMRIETFIRAMSLAAREGFTAIIVGQPLPVAEFLFRYTENNYKMPKYLLFSLGGYHCPVSLENFLLDIVKKYDSQSTIIYAYGVAEIEYGCFMGMNRTKSGEVIYHSVTDHVKSKIEDDKLLLRLESDNKYFDTDDMAQYHENGLLIKNSENRLNYNLLTGFENWTFSDWGRCTGYTGKQGKKFIFQLRQSEICLNENEMLFWQFAEKFNFSWLDKPNWN
ncbi:hypothetical protein QUF76_04330 [Desulfobacterales bacterium HSG16]|nr:hypothetical protein [Desulfobacterales bacterium HSG16]